MREIEELSILHQGEIFKVEIEYGENKPLVTVSHDEYGSSHPVYLGTALPRNELFKNLATSILLKKLAVR